MIRINLLPFRAARKKENIRRQISIYILSVVFFGAVMGYFYLDFNSQIDALEADRAEKKKELGAYADTNAKIKEIKKKIEQIQSKLKVIQGLEREKSGPVLLLEEIATAVPKEKLWLRSLDEKGGVLNLTGSAMDNDTVALFMTNLEQAKHIISVDLVSTKLKNLPKYKISVTDFVLNCKTYSFKEKPKPTTKKNSKRSRRNKN